MIEERRRVFEMWFLAQFGKDKVASLEYDIESGYLDASVSCMWFGFNAGIESANW